MKILHIAESADGGGAESVFRDTIIKLQDTDIQNQHLVACIAKGNEPFEINIDFDKTKQTVLGQIYSYNNYKILYNALSKIRPHVVHIQNYGNLSPSVLKAILEYKKVNVNTKVIQTVHTFEYVCSHYAAFDYRQNRRCTDCSKKRFKLKIFYRGCSRLGYIHSWAKGLTSLIASYYINKKVIDIWITPSELLKNYMSVGNLNSNQIKVVRNPMDASFLKQQFNLDINKNATFEFVYFGRFSEEKNIDVIIEAFSILLKHASAKLILIGKGDQKSGIVSKCINLNILDAIEMMDFIPANELVQRLKKSHVSIIASKCFETSSLVINEAVMCSLIPIISNHGAMKETLNILNVGLTFNSEDPSDLANKFKECMINYDSYFNKLGASFDIIKNVYDPEKYIQSLSDMYVLKK